MTLDELRKSKVGQLPENVHLFAVGRVEGSKPKPDQRSEGQNSQLDSGAEGFRVCITLVRFGRRALDAHDNLRASLKPLVDSITEYLGFNNDADPRLHWEYGQAGTTGQQGVLVKVEIKAL